MLSINLPIICPYLYVSNNYLLIYLLVIEGGGVWAALCYRSGVVVFQVWPQNGHPQHPWEPVGKPDSSRGSNKPSGGPAEKNCARTFSTNSLDPVLVPLVGTCLCDLGVLG